MWLIKTEHGYMLEDLDGKLVQWFDMAANCKAYCMENGIDPIYLSKKTPIDYHQAYERMTGKCVWWLQ
jgi:hypothetical protein